MTSLKCQRAMAKAAAAELSHKYYSSTPVDTIICMDGTEIIGAYMASELVIPGGFSMNGQNDISIITPEFNPVGQVLLRDNTQRMVWGKNVLLLVASVTTGETVLRAMECIRYYGGRVAGISAIFSAIIQIENVEINTMFTADDLPGYQTYLPHECPFCKKSLKVDAIVNSFGYSKI